MKNLIGRKQEIQELNNLYNSTKAQMVAVYGRRRVGKTFLVDEALKSRITFRHAGLSPNNEDSGKKNMLKDQLKHFYHSLLMHGMKKSKQPTSWLEAFFMLEQHLSNIDNGDRQVVFLDELPWLDTPRSGCRPRRPKIRKIRTERRSFRQKPPVWRSPTRFACPAL